MFTRNILVILFALLTFFACTGEDSRQMHEALMQAKAQNENYEPFTSDSTMLRVVDYYDSHGTANEQMLAHYLLGCVYRDLGDAPRALECYYDAVSKADTTSADCDFQRLSRIYGQMADLFHAQRSPQFEKEAELNAIHMAWRAKDTLAALNFYAHLADVYDLIGKTDSALFISQDACKLLKEYGFEKYAYGFLPTLISMYIDKGMNDNAKMAMDLFEKKSGWFDKKRHIIKGKESYYGLKGRYFININQIDSALYYYNRFSIYRKKIAHQENISKGLMEIYHRLGKPDSVMKYAQLFADANDSACLISSAEEINRANALYNYNASKRQAKIKEQEAEKYKQTIIISSILLILAIVIITYIIIRYKRKAHAEFITLNSRYFEAIDKYKQSIKDLELLKSDTNRYKAEKEKESEILRQTLASYTNEGTDQAKWDAEKYILHCEVINDLHNMATKGISASNVNWSKLTNLVSLHLSPIYNHITKSEYKLSDREILVCILTRLQFLPSEIAVLFNCSKQIVSNIRTNINRKLFQQEGTKTLDSNIKRL